MYFYSNLFAELAARTRAGDHEAQEQLRQELERAVVLMVRQTLLACGGTTSIARRILAAARRLTAAQGGAKFRDGEDFVQKVAHLVCEEVIGRLQPCPDGLCVGDSISNAAHGATLIVG